MQAAISLDEDDAIRYILGGLVFAVLSPSVGRAIGADQEGNPQ